MTTDWTAVEDWAFLLVGTCVGLVVAAILFVLIASAIGWVEQQIIIRRFREK